MFWHVINVLKYLNAELTHLQDNTNLNHVRQIHATNQMTITSGNSMRIIIITTPYLYMMIVRVAVERDL